jgi:hypothetical protein
MPRRPFLVAYFLNGLGILAAVAMEVAYALLSQVKPSPDFPIQLLCDPLAAAVPAIASTVAPITAVVMVRLGRNPPPKRSWAAVRWLLSRLLVSLSRQLAAGGTFIAVYKAYWFMDPTVLQAGDFAEGLIMLVILMGATLLFAVAASAPPCAVGIWIDGIFTPSKLTATSRWRPRWAVLLGAVATIAAVVAYCYALNLSWYLSKDLGSGLMLLEVAILLSAAGLSWACAAGIWALAAAGRLSDGGEKPSPLWKVSAIAASVAPACATWSVCYLFMHSVRFK